MNKISHLALAFVTTTFMAFANNACADLVRINQAPLAEISPSPISDLLAEPGGGLFIDVSRSIDPDLDDLITLWEIDLNEDGMFDMRHDLFLGPWFAVPYDLLTGPSLSLGAGDHLVRLRVWDTFGATGFDTAIFTILPAAVATVPEPQTFGLTLAGIAALWGTRRRRLTAQAE
ncbi:PEP-CTERM sorting domain-containing protein [Parazoarcus communis]|nr:PEP-CTERM sorting domain-containing protein [Parazoarcus communis]NMG72359.1 PEP-CTERM sorting domain-containing protein [Parazoarcus communis SWub3 = DSM 12120]